MNRLKRIAKAIIRTWKFIYAKDISKQEQDLRQLTAMLIVLLIVGIPIGCFSIYRAFQVELHPEIQLLESHKDVSANYPDLATVFVAWEACMAATINPNWYWCDKEVLPLASRLELAAKLEKYREERQFALDQIKRRNRGEFPQPRPQ